MRVCVSAYKYEGGRESVCMRVVLCVDRWRVRMAPYGHYHLRVLILVNLANSGFSGY